MARTLVVILFFVLAITAISAIQSEPSDEVLQLAYNPTYDLWFFLPSGRPGKLSAEIKDAYNQRRPGGVCFKQVDDWFYCATGEKIQ
ncbi:uncharacterized protein LOC133835739 [Drosophila sulfurigaster albostrigata]|uniref:uncharacterized protein LOC133835739 n=1 Tax=Drosophila sulfurigaster albostrigata TaxID=89887 RepID=UPI002D219BD8|nr:uncharacterized protein LOC133835739 [Drosophila sulfurigaster albostrigata]